MYAAGFGGAIIALVLRAAHGDASPGAVVEVVSLLRRAQRQVTGVSTSAGSFATAAITADRLLWLEDYVAGLGPRASRGPETPGDGRRDLWGSWAQPGPAHLEEGIRFEHVSFSYPGQQTRSCRTSA